MAIVLKKSCHISSYLSFFILLIINFIKNNTIKKGVKVDNPNSNYITYKYICETHNN